MTHFKDPIKIKSTLESTHDGSGNERDGER